MTKAKFSTNGTNWTTATFTTTVSGNFKNFENTNNIWSALTTTGQVFRNNQITDNLGSFSISSSYPAGITQLSTFNNQFVGVSSTAVYNSADLSTWTTTLAAGANKHITKDDKQMLLQNSGVIRNWNGSSWTTISTGINDNFVNGAIRNNSTDAGQVWTQVADSFSQIGLQFEASTESNRRIQSISYANGLWFAAGHNMQHGVSTNGTSWTTYTPSSGNFDLTGTMIYVSATNRYYRSAYNNMNLESRVQRSTNLINWVSAIDIQNGTVELLNNFTYTQYNASKQNLLYGNERFVLNGGRNVMWSDDGAYWNVSVSTAPNAFPGGGRGNDIAYGQSLFVWVGQATNILRSTNAVNWTTATSNFTNNTTISTISYGNNLWVAGAYNGQLRTSTNAITWVTRTSNFTNNDIVWWISYGNGLWFAAALDSLRSSTDTITWTTVSNADVGFTNRFVMSLAYGQGKWVAGGYKYRATQSVASQQYEHIIQGNSAFYRSTDLMIWSTIAKPPSSSVNDIISKS